MPLVPSPRADVSRPWFPSLRFCMSFSPIIEPTSSFCSRLPPAEPDLYLHRTMPRDSEATRTRILEAAIEEFSAHGLAGARIDRVSENAAANKRAVYEYFGNKEQLFDAALHHVLTKMIEDVPLTEDDLPGYAGRLFDYHVSRPQGFRMNSWRQLERPESGPDAGNMYSNKIAALAGARARGTISPADLIVLING